MQTILQNSADDVNGGGFDTDMGYGRVNAYNAVKAAIPSEVTISGNAGADGATLSYTDGTEKTATADGSGSYSFTVTSGWSGIVTPSKAGYLFTPSFKHNIRKRRCKPDRKKLFRSDWQYIIYRCPV